MNAEAVARFLIDHGHLSARDVVHGEVAISDSSARNTAFRIRRSTGPGLVFKRATSGGGPGFEPGFYALVREEPTFGPLAAWVPTVFEAHDDTIVLELVGTGLTARAAAHGGTSDPTAAGLAPRAAALGMALATCHRITATDKALRRRIPKMTPWAFRTVLPEVEDLAWLGPFQRETLRAIHRDPTVAPALWERRRRWAFESLTHGDVRWLNILLPTGDGVVLIDWEHAGIGDPAWDLASAWHAWLTHGIETLPLASDTPLIEASRAFGEALGPLSTQMATCTTAYRTALGDEARGDAIVERAAALLPFRLCQGAMEWARDRTTMTPFIALTTQLAVNLVRRSARETLAVLGLPT
jgi:hypothetical protein